MAEVYWDMEWTLQQQGFDYAYDKRLYDRLTEGHAKAVREHFFVLVRCAFVWRGHVDEKTEHRSNSPKNEKKTPKLQSITMHGSKGELLLPLRWHDYFSQYYKIDDIP